MIYKIIVDKQPMSNPSEEKKEYQININQLYYKDDIYDSLIITLKEDYVMRRLEINEYGVLTPLVTPIKEPLEDINIELFEGENYIYLYDMTGNTIVAQYLIKNEFNELYVTESEMNAAIEIRAGSIELSVQRQIQRVDSDIEELSGQVVEITTDYVKFTDLSEPNENTTINGANITTGTIKSQNYDPDDVTEGMAINLVDGTIDTKNTKWDSEGNILLNNGAQIITDKGLMTNIQAKSDFDILGYSTNQLYDTPAYHNILIYIPDNFTITNAYLTIISQPIRWSGGTLSGTHWGYPRNLALYKDYNSLVQKAPGTDVTTANYSNLIQQTLTGGLFTNNSNSWTPTEPTNVSYNTQKIVSKDIKELITKGINHFIVTSTNSVPSSQTDKYEGIGQGFAVIDIYGYTNVKNFS